MSIKKINEFHSQFEFISEVLQSANIIFKFGDDLQRARTLYLLNKMCKEIDNSK